VKSICNSFAIFPRQEMISGGVNNYSSRSKMNAFLFIYCNVSSLMVRIIPARIIDAPQSKVHK
jgi:hypothetical protein